MKRTGLLPALAASTSLSACVSYPRAEYFEGWALSAQASYSLDQESESYFQSGHLLVRGEARVLLLARTPQTRYGPVSCDRILIELPRSLDTSALQDPVAYHQECSCTWHLVLGCTEERLVRGRIKLEEVAPGSIQAALDLEFPFLHLKERATFRLDSPKAREIEPTTLSPFTGMNPLLRALFSPDGSQIVTLSQEQAKVWDSSTGALLFSLPELGPVSDITFNPDSCQLVIVQKNGQATVWQSRTGERLFTLHDRGAQVERVLFSRDGTRLLAELSRGARVWDTRTWKPLLSIKKRASTGHRAPSSGSRALFEHAAGTALGSISDVSLSPDGTQLLFLSRRGDSESIKVVSVETGKTLLRLESELDLRRSHPAYSPDGALLLIPAPYGATAEVWDAAAGKRLFSLDGGQSITQISASPDSAHLVTTDPDDEAELWDAKTGKLLFALEGEGAEGQFNASGELLFMKSGHGGRRAEVWDVQTGQLLFSLQPGSPRYAPGRFTMKFSPDGSQLILNEAPFISQQYDAEGLLHVSVESAPVPKVFEARTGKLLFSLTGHTGSYQADGSRIVTASYDGTASVWDAKTGALLLTLQQ
jgi:WD40 repeat protein